MKRKMLLLVGIMVLALGLVGDAGLLGQFADISRCHLSSLNVGGELTP